MATGVRQEDTVLRVVEIQRGEYIEEGPVSLDRNRAICQTVDDHDGAGWKRLDVLEWVEPCELLG
jgi:hypothetical protein